MPLSPSFVCISVYVHEGQTITLSCSTPNIIPMWTDPRRRIINFNDSTSLNPTFPHSSRFSIDKDGHLVINDIRPSDAGKYLCSYPGYEDETVTVIVGRTYFYFNCTCFMKRCVLFCVSNNNYFSPGISTKYHFPCLTNNPGNITHICTNTLYYNFRSGLYLL